MRHVIVLGVLFGLTGCAATRLQEAKDQKAAADKVCAAKHHPVKGDFVGTVSCIIASRDAYIETADPQDNDLEQLQDAEEMKLAEEVDAGTLSPADFHVQFARIHSDLTNQSRERKQQGAIAAAEVMQAMPQPVYQAPYQAQTPYVIEPPRSVTCDSTSLVPGYVSTTCR